eukprot:5983644-Lingulodinium_polyedra.AAC.1
MSRSSSRSASGSASSVATSSGNTPRGCATCLMPMGAPVRSHSSGWSSGSSAARRHAANSPGLTLVDTRSP